MSRLGLITFSLLALLTGIASAAPHVGKISMPVQIGMEAEDEPVPGRLAAFTVTAVALADTPVVSIAVDLPDELAVFSGDTEWQGPMRRNERRVLTFTLRVPEQGAAEIRAHAQAWSDGFVFSTRAALQLGAAAAPVPSPLPPARDGIRDFSLD
ncbi:MAG: hypothetical protein AB7U81_12160 [Thiohalomonadaceae bacterium]